MKKIICILNLVLLLTLLLAGCGNSDENKAQKTSEEFVRNIYSINDKQIAEYKEYSTKLNSDSADSMKSLQNQIESLSKNIKPLMIEDEYNNFVSNRLVFMNMQECINNDYTMQISNITLNMILYDNKKNSDGYNYEAKIKLISNKDKKETSDTRSGYVKVSKVNGNWKVSGYKMN